MPIKLQCSCGRLLRLDESLAGKRIRCPECQGVLKVPDPDVEDALAEVEIVEEPPRKRQRSARRSTERSTERSARHSTRRSAQRSAGAADSRPPRAAGARAAGPPSKPQPAEVEDYESLDFEDYDSYGEPPSEDDEWDDYEEYASPPPRRRSSRRSRGGPAAAKRDRSTRRSRTKGRAAPSSQWWMPVAGTAGAALALTGLVLFFQTIFGGISPGGRSWDDAPPLLAASAFPDLGAGRPVGNQGVQLHTVNLAGSEPGQSMQMRVYLPPGDHAPQSLPCVLVAPAGSNLLSGNSLDGSDYHAETLPYAEAGMAVVFYSIDGGLVDMESATDQQMIDAYKKFKAAQAGVLNGRNALEFVLAKLPQVDPQRVYSAGHSSAGTLSLLLAEHEPRLAGCVAYAPATDVEVRLGEVADDFAVRRAFPGITQFLKDSSPANHTDTLDCPTFVFHARDDDNEPFETTADFVDVLKQQGKNVTFETSPTGGHYDSMIDRGIPAAIGWLQTQSQQ